MQDCILQNNLITWCPLVNSLKRDAIMIDNPRLNDVLRYGR